MQHTSLIRFLTSSPNQKGDLFTRLMKDLFQALGYTDFRLDVHKSGREIDIEGQHRHLQRLLRAECKAQEDKIGGRDLNAFMGAVVRERKREKLPIDAYFIALGGFTASGIEQEKEFFGKEPSDDHLTLLSGHQVIVELEHHRLLVTDATAAEKAGQCAGRAGLSLSMLEGIELLAYEKGYVKVVYYGQNKQHSHFALIHADGTPLAGVLAQEVIDADQAVGGVLHQLTYLAPETVSANIKSVRTDALAHYQNWLRTECGHMQADGLPADTNVSASKLKLENLFIPLKALIIDEYGPDVSLPLIPLLTVDYIYDEDSDAAESKADAIAYSKAPTPISQLLAPEAKLAFLSPPGGGKSTLLKRLAAEYGFMDKAIKFADEMPAHDWLPLFIRCRDLQDLAKRSLTHILDFLPSQLSMSPKLAKAFREHIHESLQLGRVLLLLDGLDEIAEESSRKAFAKNLDTFLNLYPQVTLVLTSREAGFRLVADVIANKCQAYKLAPFTEEDVQRLCVQWHAEVINHSEDVRRKALKLAEDIWENKHIRRLAENPLLLTTLMVINRRQGGELPKNRKMLYGKAVEVLAQTWNAEAFEPMDVEDTLMQLSYLACYMMEKDIQQIGRRELLQVLKQAKVVVPELRFNQTSPAHFIKLVEYRSSLLMQVGSKVIDEEEQALYEFRHLTFQEYLAANGYVEGFHPRNGDGSSLSSLLAPHFGQSSWEEVIPLAVALARRSGEKTLAKLVVRCTNTKAEKVKNNLLYQVPVDILRRCILDEVNITSTELLHNALKQLGRLAPLTVATEFTRSMMVSKFGKVYQQVIEQVYGSDADWKDYLPAFGELAEFQVKQFSGDNKALYIEKVIELLRTPEVSFQLRGLAALKEIGAGGGLVWFKVKGTKQWASADAKAPAFKMLERQAVALYDLLDQFIQAEDERLLLGVSFALLWSPAIMPTGSLPKPSSIAKLFKLVGQDKEAYGSESVKYPSDLVYHTLCTVPLLGRDALQGEDVGTYYVDRMVPQPNEDTANRPSGQLDIMAAWYRLLPMSDEELLLNIDTFFNTGLEPTRWFRAEYENPRVVELVKELGQAGEQLLIARRERRKAEREKLDIAVTHTQYG